MVVSEIVFFFSDLAVVVAQDLVADNPRLLKKFSRKDCEACICIQKYSKAVHVEAAQGVITLQNCAESQMTFIRIQEH